MRSILMNNISVVAGLYFLLGVLGQVVSADPTVAECCDYLCR